MTNYAVSGGEPTTLYASMTASASDTTLEVPSGAPVSTWPTTYPFTVLLDYGDASFEAAAVTGPYTGSGPYTYPCIRAIDGTGLSAHSSGATVVPGTTAQDIGSPSSGGPPSPSNLPWLVVDDSGDYPIIRQGANGPAYRTTGYDCYVCYLPEGSSMTTEELDQLFARLRPGSLIRTLAYAPDPSYVTWANALANLATTVAIGKKYGHRFIFMLSTWDDGNEYYHYGAEQTSSWVTSPTTGYAATSGTYSGTYSFKNWVLGVVGQFAAEPSVSIYDLCNEPLDSGANYTSWATYCSTVSGWVKGVAPGALCYLGTYDWSGIAANGSEYSTIVSSMDLIGEHDYAQTGYSQIDDGVGPMSIIATKPGICDEYGFWAKSHYGTYSDPDLDSAFGLPAVTWEAQARFTEHYLESVFANPAIFAALYWSLKDIDSNYSPYGSPYNYIGGGQYDPINQARTHDVIKNFKIPESNFTVTTLPDMVTWVTPAQCLRYPDGSTVSSSQSSGLQQTIYDRYGRNQLTCPTSGSAPVVRHRQVTIRGRDWPSFQFSGSQYFAPGTTWEDAGTATYFMVIYPTALPGSGDYAYLISPATNVAAAAVRITSSGTVELTKYNGVSSDTVVATTTAALVTNAANLLMVQYVSGTSYRIDVNTANYPAGSSPTSGGATLVGSSATTYTATGYWFGDAAAGGANGFTGQLLEIMKFKLAANEAQISTATAYFQRKYQMQF
jgi:Cellulase (glycosyl hydrolase family 5)